jgi:NCS1 family nucleobase:cation symporter-1
MSVIVTSATVLIYGKPVWDPVALAGNIGGIGVLVGLLIISLDTVSCNIAANLVGPAYDFSALWPKRISYRTGGYITAAIGVMIMPWKLLESTQGYIFVWLTGYGALLGPVAGILIADYWLLRRARLDVEALYDRAGRYTYFRGWNLAAVAAFVIGVAPNLPGFLKAAGLQAAAGIGAPWTRLYDYAWFVGAGIAAGVYVAAMRAGGGAKASAVG